MCMKMTEKKKKDKSRYWLVTTNVGKFIVKATRWRMQQYGRQYFDEFMKSPAGAPIFFFIPYRRVMFSTVIKRLRGE